MAKCPTPENCTEHPDLCPICSKLDTEADKGMKKKNTFQRSDCRKTFSDNKRLRKENSRLKKQNQRLKSMINSVSDEDVDEVLEKKLKEKPKQKRHVCPECGNPAEEVDLGRGVYIICQIKECGYRGKK